MTHILILLAGCFPLLPTEQVEPRPLAQLSPAGVVMVESYPFGRFVTPPPPEIDAVLTSLEGLPALGGNWRSMSRNRLYFDGRDRFRLETLSLVSGGPEELRTAVVLYSPELTCEATSIGGNHARLVEAEELSAQDHAKVLAEGRTPLDRTFASRMGYLALSRYCRKRLGEAQDLERKTPSQGFEFLSSRSAQVAVLMDLQSGTMAEVRLLDAPDATVVYRFEGLLPPVPGVPAHPAKQVSWRMPGRNLAGELMPTEAAERHFEPAIEIYTAASTPTVDRTWFEWSSVAHRVTRPDGSRLRHDEQMGAAVPARASDSAATRSATRGWSATKSVLSLGIASLLLGVVEYVRRKRAGGVA